MTLSNETLVYLVLYIVSLAGHLILAGAVVVGALLAGLISWRPRRSAVATEVAACLKSWLPFLLGLAVTLGVGPLLFVQVLYQESFYSANLLLVTRFFALVPLLMFGFYLLYLGKGSYLHLQGRAASVALLLAAGCFIFIATTWTENHLLSLEPQSWPRVYLEGRSPLQAAALPRLVIFFGLATLSLACVLRYLLPPHTRSYALMAAVGGLIASVGAISWLRSAGEVGAETSQLYRYASCGAFVLLGLSWLASYRQPERVLWRTLTAVISAGLILCVLVVRECQRLAGVDLLVLAQRHDATFSHAGSWLFLAFLIANSALIVWCIRLVRRSQRQS